MGLGLGAAATGCVRPPVAVSSLLAEAQSNPVLFLDEYEGTKNLRVTGVVARVGLAHQKKTEVSLIPGTLSVEGYESTETDVYILLVPEDRKPGWLYCYVDERDRRAAGLLAQGSHVTVRGHFQEYRADGGGVIVLFDCRPESGQ